MKLLQKAMSLAENANLNTMHNYDIQLLMNFHINYALCIMNYALFKGEFFGEFKRLQEKA